MNILTIYLILKIDLWMMAAKYEFEVNESVESSRAIFQRALRFLPDETKLWIEYFKMELMCVELVVKRKELLGINDKEDSDDVTRIRFI